MAFSVYKKSNPIVSDASGLVGQGSAYFDGDNDYCLIAFPTKVPTGNAPRTVACWVRLRSYAPHWSKLVDYGDRTNLKSFVVATNKEYLALSTYAYDHVSGYHIDLNKWYHLVYVYTGTTIIMYANGILVYSSDIEPLATGNAGFGICCNATDDDVDERANANIKDVLIYDVALTKEDVLNLYHNRKVSITPVFSLPLTKNMHDYKLFEDSKFEYDVTTAIPSVTAVTSTGFNEYGRPIRYRQASLAGVNYSVLPNDDMWCHITFDDGTMISKCGSYHLSDNHGTYAEEYIDGVKKGKAVKFYRLDSNIPWGKIVNDTDFTICFWLKVPILPDWVKNGGGHWDLYGGSSWANTACITNSERRPRVQIWASQDDNNYSNPIDSLASTVEYPINEWFHFCYVKKGNEIFYFQNGKLAGQKTLSFTIKEYRVPNNTLKFGYQSDYNNYTLCIDDFRIYNKAVFTKDFIV